MSSLVPDLPDDPVLFHDRRALIQLAPGGPVIAESVELPPEFHRALLQDSGLAWVFLEPVLDESGAIVEWRGLRLNGQSPHHAVYPDLVVGQTTEAYRVPVLPEALRQLGSALRHAWRDRTRLPVTFRVTGGERIRHYTGWCFPSGDGVGLVYRDVTDPAAAGAAEPEGVRLLADVEEVAEIGSFEWLVDEDLVDLSPTAARLLGLRGVPVDLSLTGFLELIEEGDRRRVEGTVRWAAQLGSAFRSRFQIPVPGGAGGSAEPARRIIRQVGRPVVTAGRLRIVGVVEDITDTFQADQSFSRAQRLASLSMLSAGIAHDFNNVLTVITMRAELVRAGIAAAGAEAPPGGIDDDARAILEAADRASALTRQLMLFAGHQSGQPRRLDPAGVLNDLKPLIESLGNHLPTVAGMVTSWSLQPTAPVLADRPQFEQIVINLAVNARDALDESTARDGWVPTMTITLGELAAGDPLIRDRSGVERHAAWVHLQVADNGHGMSEETLARACDPFFTTQDRGRGNGLGLSVVFGILEQLGGWLDITSTEGVGTTVEVLIPAMSAFRPEQSAPDRESDQLIVVDDDATGRLVTSRTLQRAGYAVLTASSGAECLQLLETHPDVVAVVSDVVMPEMSGTELARRILADRDDLPVLLVSAFTPPTDVIGHPRLALLAKPLTSAQLTSALRRLMLVSGAAPR